MGARRIVPRPCTGQNRRTLELPHRGSAGARVPTNVGAEVRPRAPALKTSVRRVVGETTSRKPLRALGRGAVVQ